MFGRFVPLTDLSRITESLVVDNLRFKYKGEVWIFKQLIEY